MINGCALTLSVLFTQPHKRRFMWRWLILHYSDLSLSTGGSPVRIFRSGGWALPVIYLHRLHPICLFYFYVYPPWHLLQTVHKGTINTGEMLCNKEKRGRMSINMADRGGIITNRTAYKQVGSIKPLKQSLLPYSRPHNRGMDAPVIKAAPWYWYPDVYELICAQRVNAWKYILF